MQLKKADVVEKFIFRYLSGLNIQEWQQYE